MSEPASIVLVDGAWADGSCWASVICQILKRQSRPTVLVGHSYGRQIITALGADEPNIAALVHVAAFGLDEEKSLGGLVSGGPPTHAAKRMGATTVEVASSHLAMVSHPGETASLIKSAAQAMSTRTQLSAVH
jgi:predicted alpha/beta hydrolase family esterase